jgi:2',3'-cyclic-nucleotide 2'-phosphodiesterase (5'-nucleotidase family)
MNARYDSLANQQTVKIINGYKRLIDKQMNEVIGQAPIALSGGLPESTLLNLTADVMREYGAKLSGHKVDLAFMNDGGLRNTLRSGNITVGNIFEIYPFDNALVVFSIAGKDLRAGFDYISKIGGGGISGAKLVITDAKVAQLWIDSEPFDDNRIYTVATIDYLADGNDGMSCFLKSIDRRSTGMLLRDVMLQSVKEKTKLGIPVSSIIDGRITIK